MADIIKDIRLGTRKVKIFAVGDKVIWERPPEPKLKGKFTDDSTASDWWYKPNKGIATRPFDISSYVDPDTKEFAIYDISDTPFFFDNTKIERIDAIGNYGNVTDMNRLLMGCTSLVSVSLSEMELNKSTSLFWTFVDCTSLTTVIGPISGLSTDLRLMDCPLTPDSAMVFINGLATVTSTKTLTLKASTYSRLTAEQIAVATSKGWTVASA